VQKIITFLSTLNRRWVYTLVWTAVFIPLVFPMSFKINTTPEVQALYDSVESLPDSCTVLLTFDLWPNALAETEPMARTALHHLFRKNCKIVTLSTIPLGGPSVAERVTREMAALYNKQYGVDFVNLGYKPNYVSVLRGFATSIESIYPTDNSGTILAQLPLMQTVKTYDQIAFIFVVADNGIVDYWVSIVNAQFGKKMCMAVTSVMAPKQYAYMGSGQITGILGGMKGAAEYEQLVQKPGLATIGISIQSLVHFLLIALIGLGNLGYLLERRAKQKEART
jgi:hypothetical protein